MWLCKITKISFQRTCCWRLLKDYSDITMHQYFVAPNDKFCIYLSSNFLSGNDGVGATFYSSMFYHVTSVPIWSKDDEKSLLKDQLICTILLGERMVETKRNDNDVPYYIYVT